MALSIPAELKKISAYVRRAEELDKDTGTPESRLVAYYCRQYAVHTGIPLASTSAAAKECLGVLLGALETEKLAMDNFTREEAKFLCKSFADRVFSKADEEDRLGVANKATAKTFYAAATFLQILDQFMVEGDPDMDEIKKQVVYSKWKSTEILKALKEGRTPTPGGYQEHQDEDEEKEEKEEAPSEAAPPAVPRVETVQNDDDDGAYDLGIPSAPHSPPVAPPSAPMEPPAASVEDEDGEEDDAVDEGTEVELGPPPTYPGESTADSSPERQTFVAPPPPSPSPPPPQPSAPSPPPSQPPVQPTPKKSGGIFGFGKKSKAGKVSRAQLDDATELTRFALAALEDRDAELAASRLQQALQSLGR